MAQKPADTEHTSFPKPDGSSESAVKPVRRMNQVLKRVDRAISSRLLRFTDGFIDRRICGQSLVKPVPSMFRDDRKGIGGTSSSPTHYAFLKRIFSHIELKPSDAVLDVGCGKGRVLAFLLKEKCPGRLYGIEYNPKVAEIAKNWSERYPQVQILIGDAFELNCNDYTVLTLARSFLPVTYELFVQKLEETLTHPITLVSWYDQGSVRWMKKRPGWRMEYHELVKRIRGLRIASSPQSFTVWTYDPEARKAQEAKAEAGA